MSQVKKKIRPGAIELHGEELALVVHYEVQEIQQQADGTQEVTSSSQATKKITVKSLNDRTDLQALAAEVIDKCKLIHPSKVSLVQGLLQQLHQRQQQQAPAATHGSSNSGADTLASPARPSSATSVRSFSSPRPTSAAAGAAAAGGGASRPESASSRPTSAHRASQQGANSSSSSSPTRLGRQQQQHQQQQQQKLIGGLLDPEYEHQVLQQQEQLQQRVVVQASEIFEGLQSSTAQVRPAFLDELEAYIEDLYDEDLANRVTAAGMLCQLFRNTANLQVLLQRENLLSTLARLLREDGMKSLELATAVAGCFLACSCLKQLHKLLTENQVGTVLMDLLSLDLLQRSAAREAQEGPGSAPAAVAARAAAAKVGQGPAITERERRLGWLVVRQDKFVYIATATLLHLAEDATVQNKMRKKDLLGLLTAMLSRPHVELLLLTTGFLRRLCIYQEFKDRLASTPNIIPQLLSLVHPGCGDALQTTVLRLLHNLSFDAGLRKQMTQGGLVPLAVQLLDHPHSAPLAAGLLYQLSMDDAARGLFVLCPGALQRLYESIMRAMGAVGSSPGLSSNDGGFAGFAGALSAAGAGSGSDLRSVPELIALAVNLAHNKRTAELFAHGEKLQRLLKRSLAAGDELAWKLLHNLSVSGGEVIAGRILVHARGLMALLQSPDTGPELFAEVLGTLAAACDAIPISSSSSSNGEDTSSSSSSELGQLLGIEEILQLLQACFVPGALEDDALLEAVILLGALAGRPEFDVAIAESHLIGQVVDLIALKRADDEFVLQGCWAFSRFLLQPATAQVLLSQAQVVPYLVDLLQDDCAAVRRVAGGCLDIIMDTQDASAGVIRGLKFESHNQQWLRLAGPDAHAVMMAAAAAATPASGWQQQQQQQYAVMQQSAGDARDWVGDENDHSSMSTAAHAGKLNQQQQQGQYAGGQPPEQQNTGYSQMQWVSAAGTVAAAAAAPDGAGYVVVGSRQRQEQQRPSLQLQAGGQRMVLDLDEYVAGVDDFYGVGGNGAGDAILAT